ncbi:MAG TPA: Uma2 family endonuclease [Oscillatoriaceae cyanobacterium M33_DOE_052]|uniref:Uma2 family endonuclease n=1 Tax=Planktothricoides sp. SpSt-374 TaxID=2282167 RepID=A0A7C3ZQG4_9CYAN|nr:Uma2 family endonuclease [Oscillatoriaceae cyanobacterium M33_DOE_052]
MIAQVNPSSMTVTEYLTWEAQQLIKHEYIDGEVHAMTGGTLPHNDIAVNLTSLLRAFLRGKGCKVNLSDAKVKVSEQGPYFYPDVVVSCDERDRRAIEAISYPKLIVEVLSPTTAAFDRGDKFRFYRHIPTLQEYVLIDAEKVSIDRYYKTNAGKWELTAYPEDAASQEHPELELISIDFRCPLASIYEDVELIDRMAAN